MTSGGETVHHNTDVPAPTVAPVEIDDSHLIRPVLHHVTFKTTRLRDMIDWYRQVVGVEPNFQFEGGAWTSNDAANHRLAFVTMPGLKDDDEKVARTGLHHTAFEYGSLDELLGSYLRLRAQGIEPTGCLDHGLTVSFYYVDPDGNSVELQADSYGDWAQSTEFMRSDERFAADPIGQPVDPQDLVEARRSGLSSQEVHERAYRGDYPPKGPFDLRLPQ